MYSFSPKCAEPGASPDRLSSIKKNEASPDIYNFKHGGSVAKSAKQRLASSSSKAGGRRIMGETMFQSHHLSQAGIFKHD